MKKTSIRFISFLIIICILFTNITMQSFTQPNDLSAYTKITDLTTEYMQHPMGIDIQSPRFSWKMESNIIGQAQLKYEITLYKSSDPDVPVWSKQEDSNLSVGIAYDGDILDNATEYFWQVAVTAADMEVHTSDPAYFETGVTNLPEWKNAKFIQLMSSSIAPVFRREAALKGNVQSARLYITALGAYQAYLNGEQVTQLNDDGTSTYHHMNPGYSNGGYSWMYQTYNVTRYLQDESEVALAIIAGTGWYAEKMNSTTGNSAVKALLRVVYEDGTVEYIDTNLNDWKASFGGGIRKQGLYYGEEYDANAEFALGDYKNPGYDDSKWIGTGINTDSHIIKNDMNNVEAQFVRIKVTDIGPNAAGEAHKYLQIMEIEIFDEDGNNVALGKTASASNVFPTHANWKIQNLTDGDDGIESDCGYTSNGNPALPVYVTVDLGQVYKLSGLAIHCRTKTGAADITECANYPRAYEVQTANENHSNEKDWDVQLEHNAGIVKRPSGHVLRNTLDNVTTRYVRLRVNSLGPKASGENPILQIMELEVFDKNGNNVALNKSATASNYWEPVANWRLAHLTDGDNGLESDYGYTSAYNPSLPIYITIDLGQEYELDRMDIHCRTKISAETNANLCTNYPKTYDIQTASRNPESESSWTTRLSRDAGNVIRSLGLTETTYSGQLIAQHGPSGQIVDALEELPDSVTVYEGEAATSEYDGGEINVLSYYAYTHPEDDLYSSNFISVDDDQAIFENGISLKKGQKMVIDFGQNLTAIPEIKVSADKNVKMTMRFAEILNDGSKRYTDTYRGDQQLGGEARYSADGPKGSIYAKSLRTANAKAYYTFAGQEMELYQPVMTFFGYRYIEITATDDITVYSLRSRALSSVSERTGFIETNNEDVNRLLLNTAYGQLSNYFTSITGCPQRDEREAWTGDAQVFTQTGVYNFDSLAFLNSYQYNLSEITMRQGFPGSQVAYGGFQHSHARGWDDIVITEPWILYTQTGDINIIKQNWPAMTKYINMLISQERAPNLANTGTRFGDWLAFQGTGVEMMSDLYYGYIIQLMHKMALALGYGQEADRYQIKSEALKDAFIRQHVSVSDGQITVNSHIGSDPIHNAPPKERNSQTALLWMLKLGYYTDDDMKEQEIGLLLDNIKNVNQPEGSVRNNYDPNTLSVGFLGSNVIVPVLSDIGHTNVSYDVLLSDSMPSWLLTVKNGATTMWERWNSYSKENGFGDQDMNSFNHVAYGGIGEWMYMYMAGIAADQSKPGFKNVVLQPTVDQGTQYNTQERINDVKASYESYYGRIESNWKADNGALQEYHTAIPANTTATLYLPCDNQMDIDTLPYGVRYVGREKHNGFDTAVFELLSGGFDFTIEDNTVCVKVAEGYLSQTDLAVDKFALQVLINRVGELGEDDYTAESWAVLADALAKAEEVIANEDADQDMVDDACEALDAAIKALEKIGDGEDIKVTKIKINASGLFTLSIKKKAQIPVTIEPSDATDQTITWISTNTNIFTVDEDGNIAPKKQGTATLTAQSSNGLKSTIIVRITA